MGTSNSLFSISQVQGDSEFISYANQLDSYNIPSKEYIELEARMPSLNELYKGINESGIQIINERKDLEVDENSRKIIIHIFEISDSEIDHTEDLTVRYFKNQSANDSVISMIGIKTHFRILVRLATELTKFCGSIYIHNPYEILFIQKGQKYEQVWNDIKGKSS